MYSPSTLVHRRQAGWVLAPAFGLKTWTTPIFDFLNDPQTSTQGGNTIEHLCAGDIPSGCESQGSPQIPRASISYAALGGPFAPCLVSFSAWILDVVTWRRYRTLHAKYLLSL